MQNHFAADRTWEFRAQQKRVPRRALTEFLGNHLTAFAIVIGTLALSLTGFPAARVVWPLFIAVASISMVFLALIRRTGRLSALSLRVLADGALLTPLLFFLHVR